MVILPRQAELCKNNVGDMLLYIHGDRASQHRT